MKIITALLNRTGSQALLGNFFQQAFAVLNFVLAAHWLSPGSLGTWALFLTLASFVEMARYGLVQGALVHFSAHTPAPEHPQLKGASLALLAASGFALSVLLALAGWGLNQIWHLPGLEQLLLWYPLTTVIASLVRWHDMQRLAEHDFHSITRSSFAYGAFYLIILVGIRLVLPDVQAIHLLLAQIPAALLTPLVLIKKMASDASGMKVSRMWINRFWGFGKYGMGANLSSMLFQRADMLLLGAFVAPAELAIYNVAVRLVTWLDFPLNALSQMFFPRIAKANQENGLAGAGRLCEQATGLLLAISLPIGFFAFLGAPLLVRLMAGNAYLPAAHLFQILLLAVIAKPWGRLLGMTLEASGRPGMNFAMVGSSLAVNLICLLVLTPALGIEGAAIASTLSIFLTTLAGQLYFRNKLPFSRTRSLQMIWHYYCQISTRSICYLKNINI
jgi:O-antigen/teichoic acid export membrane protein